MSGDGKILAVSEGDKVVLKDARTRKPVLPPLPIPGSTNDIAFHPDGKTLAVVGLSRYVYLWEIDFESWKRVACTTAGRNLSEKEWNFYLPGEDRQKTCPALPGPQTLSDKGPVEPVGFTGSQSPGVKPDVITPEGPPVTIIPGVKTTLPAQPAAEPTPTIKLTTPTPRGPKPTMTSKRRQARPTTPMKPPTPPAGAFLRHTHENRQIFGAPAPGSQ